MNAYGFPQAPPAHTRTHGPAAQASHLAVFLVAVHHRCLQLLNVLLRPRQLILQLSHLGAVVRHTRAGAWECQTFALEGGLENLVLIDELL